MEHKKLFQYSLEYKSHSKCNTLACSLVPQTPIREVKGSGNIVYNELCMCQTQECGATNQIASFVISVTSHDFAHIIYRVNLHCAHDVGNNY